MALQQAPSDMRIAFIGSAGIPNRYGGFESFLEHCAPVIAREVDAVYVTCDASLYRDDTDAEFKGVNRLFLGIRSNGAASVAHDLLAFLKVYGRSTHIMVLGVSGGIWFPFFRLMCALGRKRLGVNVDGVEWRRGKFGLFKKGVLRLFDHLAQTFSDVVVYDNAELAPYILASAKARSKQIGYSGDHVLRLPHVDQIPGTALTVCRIEPENNLDLLIEGALASSLHRYTIVGNWDSSAYGRRLRERHRANQRLVLLDPVYEPHRLAELRGSCALYLHGHSVGGTNPSLVEMLYYDCKILCLDVGYNRATAGASATYFTDVSGLRRLIVDAMNEAACAKAGHRSDMRARYTSYAVARAYVEALRG